VNRNNYDLKDRYFIEEGPGNYHREETRKERHLDLTWAFSKWGGE